MTNGAELSSARPRKLGRTLDDARAGIAENLPLVTLVLLYALGAAISRQIFGAPDDIRWMASWRLLWAFTLLYVAAASCGSLVHVVAIEHRTLRKAETWRLLGSRLFSTRKLVSFGVVFLALSAMMPIFVAFKSSIPTLHPFAWDETFMRIDRWLHFGRHPYEWLFPALGRPAVTRGVDFLYFLWIHVMWITVVWQAWHGRRDTPTRSQFLLSFGLCWIVLGTVFATLLSSAGPIYYSQVVGIPDPYTPLMEHLAAADVMHELRVLRIRELLWASYENPGDTIVAGISAMPSLHIAIVVLLTFLGFSVDRRLGWAYAGFALIIFVGSIHLAWHYAIDGYASALAVPPIWWMSGRVIRWWETRS